MVLDNEEIFKPEKRRRGRPRGCKSKGESKNNKNYSSDKLYDENGVHIASGKDICDCLEGGCSGCFNPCANCGSKKCSFKCRCLRKYVVLCVQDEIDEDEDEDDDKQQQQSVRNWKNAIQTANDN